MRLLLLCLLLSNLVSPLAKGAAGGWSSVGGEYIVTKNNPWFMGDQPVTWCIDHGGNQQFSLPLEQAKAEIEAAINTLVLPLRDINNNPTSIKLPSGGDGTLYKKWGVTKVESEDSFSWQKVCDQTKECATSSNISPKDVLKISDSYEYSESCNDADIIFILGNIEHPLITTFREKVGDQQFKKLAAVTVRTEYNIAKLRGKGFIYIAADKGSLQYSGEISRKFNGDTIWNKHQKLDPSLPLPCFATPLSLNMNSKDLKLKSQTLGPLKPVVTHELGHVLGIGHNHFGEGFSDNNITSIMNEDYPAKVIAQGLEFKGNFKRVAQLFQKGLFANDTKPLRFGLEWSFLQLSNKQELNELLTSQGALGGFLFGFLEPVSFEDILEKVYKSSQKFSFVFDLYPAGEKDKTKGKVQLVTLSQDKTISYKKITEYEIKLDRSCYNPEVIESVRLRYPQARSGVSTNKTIRLLSFETQYLCGTITLEKQNDTKLKFMVTHSYFNSNSKMLLTDPKTGYTLRLWLTDSDIYQRYHGALPRPALNFSTEKQNPLLLRQGLTRGIYLGPQRQSGVQCRGK